MPRPSSELFETAFQRHGRCAPPHLLLRAAHCLHACARFANGSTVQCATDPAAPILSGASPSLFLTRPTSRTQVTLCKGFGLTEHTSETHWHIWVVRLPIGFYAARGRAASGCPAAVAVHITVAPAAQWGGDSRQTRIFNALAASLADPSLPLLPERTCAK